MNIYEAINLLNNSNENKSVIVTEFVGDAIVRQWRVYECENISSTYGNIIINSLEYNTHIQLRPEITYFIEVNSCKTTISFTYQMCNEYENITIENN